MRVKIIQCDTRNIILQLKSRNLYYGKKDEFHINHIINNNNNIIPHHPESMETALSLSCLVNMMKCKMMSLEYEFIKGNNDDWNFGKNNQNPDPTKRDVTWLKPKVLSEKMSEKENESIDIFCILDTDAWVRDETLFLEFLETFSKSATTIAMPEDLDRSSLLNSGFYAIKNTEKGRNLINTINTDPAYKKYYNVVFHEQAAMCDYYREHKEEFMVLPLNDFNTPCGSVVRHAWINNIFYKLIVDEVLSIFTGFTLSMANNTTLNLGNDLMFYDTKVKPGVIPEIRPLNKMSSILPKLSPQ
jgi:hypothetical protein